MAKRTHDENSVSRTYPLSDAMVESLSSLDPAEKITAIAALPDALSTAELDDIALQVSNSQSTLDHLIKRRGLSRDLLFDIGLHALPRGDLVTAENTALTLRRKGVAGVAGSLLIKRHLKRIKQQITDELVS